MDHSSVKADWRSLLCAALLAMCMLLSCCGQSPDQDNESRTNEDIIIENPDNDSSDHDQNDEDDEIIFVDTEPADPLTVYLNSLDTEQVLMIIGDGIANNTADAIFYERSDDGWVNRHSTKAVVGLNGFSDSTYEGDMTTPTGVFSLGLAFGILPDPGTELEWVDVNDCLYWVDDINSTYYNQLIDIRNVPDGWSSGEHLISFPGYYDYAVNIEVNPPYQTSAIFLHCTGAVDYTGGCVAVPTDDMIWLLKTLRPGSKIAIFKCENDFLNN